MLLQRFSLDIVLLKEQPERRIKEILSTQPQNELKKILEARKYNVVYSLKGLFSLPLGILLGYKENAPAEKDLLEHAQRLNIPYFYPRETYYIPDP